ncbi:FitA-like ribbon-helix-helix domain-containing protein [Niveispirillum sp. KHB5.9]|uniref:FitA-like ribbon-helix-helix domain-containing protein n=1 Tax=Niveispirillum sp. KHB5.9 TaxID=3400269 RepID=UPI003A8A078E
MGSLTIRNLDDSLLQRLRDLALRSGRTVEEEAAALLADGVQTQAMNREELFARMDAFRTSLAGRIQVPSEELLRQMRDER